MFCLLLLVVVVVFIYHTFTVPSILLLSGWLHFNIFNLKQQLFAFTNIFLLFKKRSPTFGGDTSILGGTAPSFEGTAPIIGKLPQFSGELSQTQEKRLRMCLEGNETPPFDRSTSLNLLPKIKCVFTAIRQPVELGVIIVSQQHVATVCKLLND